MKKEIVPVARKSDNYYMRAAMRYAKRAEEYGEVPVGAIIVYEGRIIAGGRNRREAGKNALLHAEIEAIDKACRRLSGWRLHLCDMYVTLEPCPMCAGAIINSRLRRVYIGASDKKAGCFGSVCDFNRLPFNHKPEIFTGLLSDECSKMLTDFFTRLRNK